MLFIPKFFIKLFIYGLIWLFVFSIRFDTRTLFSHAHEVFVENEYVENFDESLVDLWYRVKRIAKATYNEVDDNDSTQSM